MAVSVGYQGGMHATAAAAAMMGHALVIHIREVHAWISGMSLLARLHDWSLLIL